MHKRRAVGRDALDGNVVQDVEQVARDGLAVVRYALLVDTAAEGNDELVAVLLDDEADELLRHVKVRLQYKERVEGVRAAGVRVVEEVLDFREGSLTESCAQP